MDDYRKLINQLKTRKEDLDLTQIQIAERMQIERVRVNEIFSNQKTNMTVKTLLKLCKALKVKITLTD